MRDLLEQKKEEIFRLLKEMESRKPLQVKFDEVVFLIVESKTNFPLFFSLENDENEVKIIDGNPERSDFPKNESDTVIFHFGNSNFDYNSLERSLTKKIIQTKALDFGDFADVSISVFGVNKEESIFLSVFIASIIFSTSMEKIIGKMEEKDVPSRIKDEHFYLYDYL